MQPHGQQPTRLSHPWDSPGKNTGVGCHFLLQCIKVKSEVTQSCPTLSDPVDCSRPGSSVHGIFQARGLEWGAISFSRESSQPSNQTQAVLIIQRLYSLSFRSSSWCAKKLFQLHLLLLTKELYPKLPHIPCFFQTPCFSTAVFSTRKYFLYLSPTLISEEILLIL